LLAEHKEGVNNLFIITSFLAWQEKLKLLPLKSLKTG